ncbi:MAG: hypothetical protein AAFZ07_28975 [Actinomycetota bacterium]
MTAAKVAYELRDRPPGGCVGVAVFNALAYLVPLIAFDDRPDATFYVMGGSGRRRLVARCRADRDQASVVAAKLERDIERLGCERAVAEFQLPITVSRPKARTRAVIAISVAALIVGSALLFTFGPDDDRSNGLALGALILTVTAAQTFALYRLDLGDPDD